MRPGCRYVTRIFSVHELRAGLGALMRRGITERQQREALSLVRHEISLQAGDVGTDSATGSACASAPRATISPEPSLPPHASRPAAARLLHPMLLRVGPANPIGL